LKVFTYVTGCAWIKLYLLSTAVTLEVLLRAVPEMLLVLVSMAACTQLQAANSRINNKTSVPGKKFLLFFVPSFPMAIGIRGDVLPVDVMSPAEPARFAEENKRGFFPDLRKRKKYPAEKVDFHG
jgi:hypothetical protein